MRCCRLYTFDAASGPRRLMRVGLALILVGHVNLLLGAVLHGTVLRHVANPRGAVTPEYTTANVISVGSGLLSVSVGLVALLASRNLLLPRLHWALLAVALMNLLLSAACSLGLLLAVSLTVANGGRRLIADCHPGLLDPLLPLDQGPGQADCPFDPTRIYDTALALWIPSVFMSAAEAALSGYCCVAALTLRGVGPYRKEGLQEQLEELTDLDLPKCTRQENEQLLDQNQEIQALQKSWA
ncbi:keratinocyte-associated protein 3 [Canis lupus baileyi]|uniref:Keratinocyte associated protein 3 n=2 Tax=Canis lupus TaxID=9612 RepID=A0A8C0S8M7_CANLF|nr:keratinocyte-associated protein 3 [Canis lupus dingo]XP_853799.1 keratinocyte-associated protein 3 isoform X1 [Canis lupus familiaris]|eukprot:XP_853799.1 keratinocyte-associated protein 3 isoform X2 [Canis lupus familiaris]